MAARERRNSLQNLSKTLLELPNKDTARRCDTLTSCLPKTVAVRAIKSSEKTQKRPEK